MHSLHEALVNGLFLGFCCMSYSLQQPSNRIAEDDHGELQIQGTPRALHLHDFIRAGSQLMRDKTLCIKRYDEQHGTILERLQHGKEYPWAEILTLNIPKFFSDIVESILGALYIDTRGDLAICEALVQRLGILDVMQHLLDDEVEVMSPKERLGIAAGNAEVKYRTTLVNEEDGKRRWPERRRATRWRSRTLETDCYDLCIGRGAASTWHSHRPKVKSVPRSNEMLRDCTPP
jgi:hypothetical protein